MPDVEFVNLLIVAAIAVTAPLVEYRRCVDGSWAAISEPVMPSSVTYWPSGVSVTASGAGVSA